MTNLQIEHLVERWEDRREVKNQMGKFVHYLLLKKEADMVADLWSGRDDICYGVNDGWYAGRDAVKNFFGWFPGYTAKVAACIKEKFPEELAGKSDDEIFGIGLMEIKSISNYVIEVAEDGETAKGFCSLFGFNTTADTRGPISNWILGTLTVDFIYEDDAWKIWHMQYFTDIDNEAGSPLGESDFPDLPEFESLRGLEAPKPSQAAALYEKYSGTRAATKLPRLPEPYTTFAETFSYGL